jgi:hypothetical protein
MRKFAANAHADPASGQPAACLHEIAAAAQNFNRSMA